MDAEERRGERLGLWRLAVIPIVLLLIAVVWPLLHLGTRLIELRAWIASLGPLAPVVYTVVEAFMVPLVVPALAMTVGAAALFGPVIGTVVVVVGSNIGSAFCFLIARYVARDSVTRLVERREDIDRFDRLVAERGALAVVLVRLIPISPFELVSYAFGLTRVPFGTFLLWTLIGSLPGAVLYVVGSATIIDVLTTGRVPLELLVVLAIVLALLTVLATRLTRGLRA